MYEIDDLLKSSVELWRDDPREAEMAYNLEQLPERLGLDAGIAPTGAAPHPLLHVYALGADTMQRAAARGRADLVYDWCAFLLGFWSHMPTDEAYAAERVERDWFGPMREAWSAVDTSGYRPRHATLTVRPEGHPDWFSAEHNALIRAFFSGL